MNSESDREAIYARLEIMGTTVPVDPRRLPHRLAPVYRRIDAPDTILLPIDEEGPEPPIFQQENVRWFQEQLDDGGIEPIDPPLRARADHILLQVDAGRPPELIHVQELEHRLKALYIESLSELDRALIRDERAAAMYLAARVLRVARAWDPLPRLLQLALARHPPLGQELPERHLARLEDGVRVFSESKLWSVARELRRNDHRAVMTLVEQELEHWLPGFGEREHASQRAPSSCDQRPRPAYLPYTAASGRTLRDLRARVAL